MRASASQRVHEKGRMKPQLQRGRRVAQSWQMGSWSMYQLAGTADGAALACSGASCLLSLDLPIRRALGDSDNDRQRSLPVRVPAERITVREMEVGRPG